MAYGVVSKVLNSGKMTGEKKWYTGLAQIYSNRNSTSFGLKHFAVVEGSLQPKNVAMAAHISGQK